jgi:signal transduction histidine kinase
MGDAENSSPASVTVRWPRTSTVVRPATILVTLVLAWLAVLGGLGWPGASPWMVALDVAVGLVFVGGALVAPGPTRMRLLVGLVGVAWLAGSVAPIALLLHRGALVIALVTFPRGRMRGLEAWIAVAIAGLVALALVPQGFVALLFGAIAVRSLWRRSSALAYPFAAAAGVALALGGSWLARAVDPFGYNPLVADVGYSVVLMLVAIGFPVAMQAIEDRTALRQRVLREEGLTGLDGLGAVLADALGDHSLRVYRWDPKVEGYVDADGEPVPPRPPAVQWLPIVDGSAPLGMVAHRSAALDDERTAAAITDAVSLALVNLSVQQELQVHLHELEAARARLLATVDRERAAVAARLRDDVVVRIGDAAAALREASIEPPTGDAADAVAVALGELDGASDELLQLVNGLGPGGLGDGGLTSVLHEVAMRSPLEVEVVAEPGAVGDLIAETALYYACLEAVANAAKHASARRLRITIRRRKDALEAIVSDDGVGGADPGGSGLRGLADRLEACGGRLRVESPAGAGTTLIAEVPASRSSATPPG